jgi:hypothetical protein
VDAPAGVPIDAIAPTDGCQYTWSYEDPSCTAAFLRFIENTAGAPATSLASCYKASEFSLGTGLCQERPAWRQNCDPSCNGLPPGPHECKLIKDSGDVVKRDMEAGTETVIGNVGGFREYSSVAFDGDSVFGCTHGWGPLTRVNMADGSETALGIECAAITNYQGGFLVLDKVAADLLIYYPTYADLEANLGTPINIPTFASRISVHGDTLYAAWHSTFEIQTYSLSTLAHTGTIELEGYNTWVMGMSVTDDGVLFLNGSWPEGRIAAFDVNTGTALANFDVRDRSSGLVCSSP